MGHGQEWALLDVLIVADLGGLNLGRHLDLIRDSKVLSSCHCVEFDLINDRLDEIELAYVRHAQSLARLRKQSLWHNICCPFVVISPFHVFLFVGVLGDVSLALVPLTLLEIALVEAAGAVSDITRD